MKNLDVLDSEKNDSKIIYEKTNSGAYLGRIAKIYDGVDQNTFVKLFLNSEKMLEILKGFTKIDSEIMLIDFKSQAEELINEIEKNRKET